MKSSRSKRTEQQRLRRRKTAQLALVAVGTVLLVATAVWIAYAATAVDSGSPAVTLESSLVTTEPATLETSPSTVESTAPMAEMPSVVGGTLEEARMALAALGLPFDVIEDVSRETNKAGDDRVVSAQEPSAGQLVGAGSRVAITVPRSVRSAVPKIETGFVVVIDPGHQSRSDSKLEPIGPGASETKPRVTGGTQGVATGIPEYEVVLQISEQLKAELESRGVTVVMTRTKNDVNLSNSERAQIANEADADLFIRVHADGSTDSNVSGISTLYPGKNQWTGPIVGDSTRAARAVQDGMIAATGASSKGTVARDDIAGFNWSKVPAVLVECGFMSNPVEDRLLSSAHYQEKLADGIADGVMLYLEGE